MKRIVILGGTGFFGGLVAQKLRAAGLEPLVASRNAELRIDADNPEDLRAHLKQRDLVIDAAGPFHKRSLALIEAAAKIGFDVIDLSDSAEYAQRIYEREAPIAAAGIRVLTACSALSTLSAAVLTMSSVTQPKKLAAYLRPAAHLTANRGSLDSFLASLTGRRRTILFAQPLGVRHGLIVRTVDAVTLPRVFPSLREAELIVDVGLPGANALVRASLSRPQLRRIFDRFQDAALRLVKRFGPKSGVLAYEIAAAAGHKHQFFSGQQAHLTAVMPAVLAAQSIAAGKFPHRGIVPPTQHVDPQALFEALGKEGLAVVPPWGT